MKRIYISLWVSLFVLQLAAQSSFTPVIINGQVFFKTELERTNDEVIFAEVTVTEFEQLGEVFYNRAFFKRGFEADMLVGYLREVPEEGQLFFRPLTSNEDILVYDISLEVGDQLTLAARWCDDENSNIAEVLRVDEVDNRRVLTFNRLVGESAICDTLRFIEGVGPSASVIFPHFQDAVVDNGAAMRICHASNNNVIFYPSSGEEDFCGLMITDTEDLDISAAFRAFPNPTRGIIQLSIPFAAGTLTLFDMYGQVLTQHAYQQTLDLSSYPAGIYVINWQAENGGSSQLMRIVKE